MEIFKTTVAGKEISIETGRMAKQANGAVVVRSGDTMVICTACGSKEMRDGQSFFPLSVEYVEKTYASGKIPGGYFKREGKLSEKEVLTCRLIDRPIRPLFPEGFLNEVQVIVTVVSADKENDADFLGLIGASAALSISDIPFKEPVATLRLGRVNGEFVLGWPSSKLVAEGSEMNVLVAGTESSIIMVEGECHEVDEQTMLDGLFMAHKELQPLIALQKEMKSKLGKADMEWTGPERPAAVVEFVRNTFKDDIAASLKIKDKIERYAKKDEIKKAAIEQATEKFEENDEVSSSAIPSTVADTLDAIASEAMRASIINDGARIDGRDMTTVRPIEIETGVLPRAHGSVLFTRGETQALVTCTLGAMDDAQRMDSLHGSFEKRFLLHYNFPAFSVGEVKPMRGPSRRDIGHGNLAEGSLLSVIPTTKDFPYTLRIVSEILESNGSSSMATVCGGSLAMMDAGVPGIKPTAGIAMGLIAEGDKMIVLTDILGDEDHLGDMDFKVTGTKDGINGFQLDTKISGISMEVMQKALNQAKEARLHILDKMTTVLPSSRSDISEYAPKRITIKVRQSKIKDIIGPGGKNIRSVVDATNVKVDIEDDGSVQIFSTDPEMAKKAVEMIEALSGEVEIGRIYDGVVRKIMDFGAFVNIAPGTDGLVHISELDEERVNRVEDILNEGDRVAVKVLEIDRQGRIRLSRKEALREKAS